MKEHTNINIVNEQLTITTLIKQQTIENKQAKTHEGNKINNNKNNQTHHKTATNTNNKQQSNKKTHTQHLRKNQA